jgi:predicted AAA+ superfamily ATPase
MLSKETAERELRPLQNIQDNYEKIILSLDRNYINSYAGIKNLNLIDWLLE